MGFEGSYTLARTIAGWWVDDTVWLDWCVVYGVCPKCGEYAFDGDVFVAWLRGIWDGLARGGNGLWLRLYAAETFSIWDMECAGAGDILTEVGEWWLDEVVLHWLEMGGEVLAI